MLTKQPVGASEDKLIESQKGDGASETRPKDLYRCGQNTKISKSVTLHYITNLLRNIDLEMLPHLKILTSKLMDFKII